MEVNNKVKIDFADVVSYNPAETDRHFRGLTAIIRAMRALTIETYQLRNVSHLMPYHKTHHPRRQSSSYLSLQEH
jgi:hypothetical protein